MASARALTPREINLARSVFQGTIQYGKVSVLDDLGWQSTAYTSPNVFGGYDIHIGSDAAKSLASTENFLGLFQPLRQVFIHELTHVWQGQNRGWGYLLSSLSCQFQYGSGAYDYNPGLPWNSYGAEQQASIVEDWFVNGMSTTDELFLYIRDVIRQPEVNTALPSSPTTSSPGYHGINTGNRKRDEIERKKHLRPGPGPGQV